jgi:hypothetical protein
LPVDPKPYGKKTDFFKNSPKKFSFDSFDKNIIHEKINKFHKKKFSLQLETFSMKLKKMKIQVLKDVVLKLLGNLLKKMGFKFVKTEDIARKIVIMT